VKLGPQLKMLTLFSFPNVNYLFTKDDKKLWKLNIMKQTTINDDSKKAEENNLHT